jgi:hypothetical protein
MLCGFGPLHEGWLRVRSSLPSHSPSVLLQERAGARVLNSLPRGGKTTVRASGAAAPLSATS